MTRSSTGTIYILISAFLYASYGVWSRLMTSGFGEFSQAWTRGLLLLVIVLIYGLLSNTFKRIRRRDWIWFIGTGLAGGLNQAPYYFGFEHLGVGTATLLFYASLVVGGYVLGILIFNEVMTRTKLLSLMLALAGMFSLYHFSIDSLLFVPVLATIFAGILGAATVVFPKKLSLEYSEAQIMSSYFIAQVVINMPLSYYSQDIIPTFTSTTWLYQLGYAMSMLFANMAAIKGFKYLESSVASVIGTTEIVFGLLFGYLLFRESVSQGTLIGTALILLAAVIPWLSHNRRV